MANPLPVRSGTSPLEAPIPGRSPVPSGCTAPESSAWSSEKGFALSKKHRVQALRRRSLHDLHQSDRAEQAGDKDGCPKQNLIF